MKVNAIDIEYAFCMLIGSSQGALDDLVDAKYFEYGDPEVIGTLLEKSAEILSERIENISYSKSELKEGKIRPRLQLALDGLKSLASEMKQLTKLEPNDYHWLIVGSLVQVIGRCQGSCRLKCIHHAASAAA